MFVTRTPLIVSAPIKALCDDIRPGVDPVFLRIEPGPDDEALDCFNNVRRRIDRDGGSLEFGWAIWEWPNVYIEAEHHAVYVRPGDDGWQDITPAQTPGYRRRLFLPDDSATYDFENEGVARDNHRRALSSSPLVTAMFAAAAERVSILNSIPGIGMVTADEETGFRLQTTLMEIMRLQVEIGMTHTAPRATCFCGSGKMFKQCHARRA